MSTAVMAPESICLAHLQRTGKRVKAYRMDLCHDCFSGKAIRPMEATGEAKTETDVVPRKKPAKEHASKQFYNTSPARPWVGNSNPEEVIAAVALLFKMHPNDMQNPTRARKIAHPRSIAMYVLRQTTNLSLPAIGNLFGGYDHATVMHHCRRVRAQMEQEVNLRITVERLLKHFEPTRVQG